LARARQACCPVGKQGRIGIAQGPADAGLVEHKSTHRVTKLKNIGIVRSIPDLHSHEEVLQASLVFTHRIVLIERG
jgi:predicted urease superfamily metal-dependent hydrolase